MQTKEVTVGMQVVVNKRPDTHIYTVEALTGFPNYQAKLSYDSDGVRMSGGWMDVSMLLKPTADQLSYRKGN